MQITLLHSIELWKVIGIDLKVRKTKTFYVKYFVVDVYESKCTTFFIEIEDIDFDNIIYVKPCAICLSLNLQKKKKTRRVAFLQNVFFFQRTNVRNWRLKIKF